ncbi:MAG TPA: hypothetical protein VIL07_09260, partial [Symbiobacteriaceae bacterium]
MTEIEKRLEDLELVQQLLVDIATGQQPNVARTLLLYTPSEVRSVNAFMKWISQAKPQTWDDLVKEWVRRLPHRTTDDLAALWQAYRDDGLDGPVFQL